MKRFEWNNDDLRSVIENAYHKFKNINGGKNADYIPFLKTVDSNLFGISVCLTDGTRIEYGDTDFHFGIESISKVPTAILALEQYESDFILEKIGANATGLDFGSLFAILLENDHPSTPLVNAGAISACSLIKPTGDSASKWSAIQSNLNDLCGSTTEIIDDLYKNESSTNFHNRSIAWLLKSYDRIYDDPDLALDLYTRQCSVGVTSTQIAIMASTIANRGKNPVTGKQVFKSQHAPGIISMIATVGMYEETGDWMFQSGTPAKSGVGGGIMAIIPQVLGICVFSPPLNKFGNSVKGKHTVKYIIDQLALSIYE